MKGKKEQLKYSADRTSAKLLSAEQKEAALQTKSRLIDKMAYQIRTLSNAIIGFSNLLSLEKLTDAQKEYVSEIRQAGQGLSSLVESVLDLAQIESGKLKPDYTDCDLADLFEEVETHVSRAAAQKGLEFSIETAGRLPARIKTDYGRLRNCLLHLAGNAIVFTEKGYVKILVGLDWIQETPFIRFDVVDTGRGIASSRLRSIFEPAAYEDDSNSRMFATLNLGLRACGGLTMTQQLINLMEGKIQIISEPGVGSTFSLLIPARTDVGSEKPLQYPPQRDRYCLPEENCDSIQCLGHILVVEDEESNRTVLSLLLENLGLKVTAAATSSEAVELARQNEFDMILMDIQLPDMDGLQTARLLKEQGFAAPITGLSAGVLSEADRQQIQEVFDAFLMKPVDSDRLQDLMTAFLPTVKATAEECAAGKHSRD